MKDSYYLVFDRSGVVKMLKQQKPDLRRNQHAVKVNLEVPDKYFRSAIPEVTLRLEEEDVIRPEVGMVVQEQGEDGEEKTVVRDPQDAVNEMAEEVADGGVLTGLPQWAYAAVLSKLRDEWDFVEERHGLEHGLKKVPGEDRATLVIHRADVDPAEVLEP